MIRTITILWGWVLAFALCASPARGDDRPVPEFDANAALPATAAMFRTRIGDDEHRPAVEWRLWRDADRLVSEHPLDGTAEHWQRDGKAIFHYKMFHADRKGIEFMVEDLDMLGIPPRWMRQALLIDPELLAKLDTVATGWNGDRPWRRYAGTIDGTRWEITLRMDLLLPERIESWRDEQRLRTDLVAAYPLDAAPWQPTPTQGYEIIDFADIGDRESDPFIRRIQGSLGIGHEHGHAQHGH